MKKVSKRRAKAVAYEYLAAACTNHLTIGAGGDDPEFDSDENMEVLAQCFTEIGAEMERRAARLSKPKTP